MAEEVSSSSIPVPEELLRHLAKNVAKSLPQFAEQNADNGVKELHRIIDPVLETVDLSELAPRHRAAASNALCAIIECFYSSNIDYMRSAILDDSIWIRVFEMYLERSDDAIGKSMRQVLLALTNVITRHSSSRELELQYHAARTFLDVIRKRQDRVKVKPALQGLAHFLLRDAISITKLINLHVKLQIRPSRGRKKFTETQLLFESILSWAVHHDTALSAGHLVKNFLLQARRLQSYGVEAKDGTILPLWIEPVVLTLHDWPDRIQYFQTHVFPHCFLPNIAEYTQFLLYLHLDVHVQSYVALSPQLRTLGLYCNGLNNSEEFRILLAAIQTGKEQRILRENDSRLGGALQVQNEAIYLPDNVFGFWMAHSEPEVRLAGLFLSVYSFSITKIIAGGVLESLERNLDHLHADTDTNFRREVYGHTQKLFDRLRASTATLWKGKCKSSAPNQSRLAIPKYQFQRKVLCRQNSVQDPLVEALTFIIWYVHFLEFEMRPTASYQRRTTALRCISIVLRSGLDPKVQHSELSKSAQGQLNWVHGLQIATPKVIRVLFDQILDPFDDIRDAAISTLRLCLLTLPLAQRNVVLESIPRFLARAEELMLQTGRADQADGVARAYGLIFSFASSNQKDSEDTGFASKSRVFKRLMLQLEETLKMAQSDLVKAVEGRPIHGIYASLRYIVDQGDFYPNMSAASKETYEEWKQLHTVILESLEPLWSNVYSTLCADAPEGFVPDGIENEVSVDTKEISSYSWRGLKEASTLIRVIISKCPIGQDDRSVISTEQFEKLGRLCFVQLLELRHRGAFSTVSHTFAAFCRRCSSSGISELRALPEKWYQEILRSMHDKAGAITRRSAGIPALMSGILVADQYKGGLLLPRAIKDLVQEASANAENKNIEESHLPQVHALNCIKEIFASSGLGLASEVYIGQGLELAAKTLTSSVWPIRNCSMMLFNAMIERLFGDETQDWKDRERSKTSRFSYYNYPNLASILTSLLNSSNQSSQLKVDNSSPLDLHGAEGVFPALQILRQARPPEPILGPILESVEVFLGSPHWHLRDMAARTPVSMRLPSQLLQAGLSQLSKMPDSENAKHGTLLSVKYTFQKLFQDPMYLDLQELGILMSKLSAASPGWYSATTSPFIRPTFLDILNLCGMAILRRPDLSKILQNWKDLTASVSIGPEYVLGIQNGHGDTSFMIASAQAFLIDRVIQHVEQSSEQQGIGDALEMLAREDPDICCAALETLDSIVQIQNSGSINVSSSFISEHIQEGILFNSKPDVVHKAQTLLANALTDHKRRADFFSQLSEDQVMSMLIKLEAQCQSSSPSNMQTALHLLAFVLDFAYQNCPNQQRDVLKATSHFIRLLRMAIIDISPFDMRFAAVQSMYALQNIWTASTRSKSTAPLLLGLSIILYDLLNDDDDEIRQLAASTTADLLRAQRDSNFKNTVPLHSAHRLASFLSTAFSTSPDLVREATRRLTDTPSPTALFQIPFAQAFAAARHVDTSLFASEKQNLYKDDTLDTVLWSRVLIRQPPHTIPQSLQSGLAKWVLDGLRVLIHTAETEVDGPLGWTSKPEVFALGMRVFCAAEVVLAWEKKDYTVLHTLKESGAQTIKGVESMRSRVLKGLRYFVEVGYEAEVHPLWLERIECVLEKQVWRTLRLVRRRLVVLRGNIEEQKQ